MPSPRLSPRGEGENKRKTGYRHARQTHPYPDRPPPASGGTNQEQIRAISLDYPEITIDDAYAVQREWVSLKIAEGRVLKGHKIGLTSKAMQASSQISEPDYGALLDDMFFHDGSDIPVDRFIVPRIEVELAFVLAKPLRGPNCTIFDVYNATDYVIPALELIDARCHNVDPETQRPRKVFDTISDNAANAG